jgi:ATP-dependent helicase HrpA
VDRRLEKLQENPRRDVERTEEIAEITEEYRELVAGLPAGLSGSEPVRRIRWMIEELRVSYFAQTLRTAYPVSEKRIRKAMDEILA